MYFSIKLLLLYLLVSTAGLGVQSSTELHASAPQQEIVTGPSSQPLPEKSSKLVSKFPIPSSGTRNTVVIDLTQSDYDGTHHPKTQLSLQSGTYQHSGEPFQPQDLTQSNYDDAQLPKSSPSLQIGACYNEQHSDEPFQPQDQTAEGNLYSTSLFFAFGEKKNIQYSWT